MWKKWLTLGLISLVRAVRFYRANRTVLEDLRNQVQIRINDLSKARADLDQAVELKDRHRRGGLEIKAISEMNDKIHSEQVEELKNSKSVMGKQRDEATDRKLDAEAALTIFKTDTASEQANWQTCPCPTCRLIRKFPKYGYIQRIVKAVARGEAN